MATCIKSNIRAVKEINSLPVEDYDLVINDFEPVSAWACYAKNVPCIGLSHQLGQFLLRSTQTETRRDVVGKLILKNYAPNTEQYGFHFSYAQNIFTPVIRKQVRDEEVKNHGHYTLSIYLLMILIDCHNS